MSRSAATAIRFDPQSQRPATGQNSSSTDYSYCDWKFYEKDSYLISVDLELVGKAAYDKSQRSNFIYLGRKTAKSVSVIKFSFFEGTRLLSLVTQCLDEVAANGGNVGKLIPMLEGKKDAKVTLTRDNKSVYFENAQIDMQNLKGKFCFSEIQGEIMLHLLSPVSAEITQKLKGWLGPVASLNVKDIERLEGFLKETLEERE